MSNIITDGQKTWTLREVSLVDFGYWTIHAVIDGLVTWEVGEHKHRYVKGLPDHIEFEDGTFTIQFEGDEIRSYCSICGYPKEEKC